MVGRSYVYAKTHLRTHLDKKYGKILSQFWWILNVKCQNVCIIMRTNINLWQNVWWCWYHPFDDLSPISAEWMSAWSYTFFVIYHYQECVILAKLHTAQTRIRCHILRRLIWVYAVCICPFFTCIQPVPQEHTLNFRLATPLNKYFNMQTVKICTSCLLRWKRS